jgi:hypothetical protein
MNMSPKVRPLWQRLLLMVGTSILWAYKALHLPKFLLRVTSRVLLRIGNMKCSGC